MHDPRLALVPVSASAPAFPAVAPRSIVGPGFGVAGALAIGALLAGLPMLSICIFAAGGFAATVIGAASRLRGGARGAISPDEIASDAMREVYRDIQLALADLEGALAASARLRSTIAPVLEGSRAAMLLCGRMAQLANPLHHYLEAHDPMCIRAELDRLRARVELASDDRATSAWSHATAARARQLATYEQMREMRDRILARLELVRAALESFAAMIVKLEVFDEAQLAVVSASVAEHLDGIGDELEALESAFATDTAT